MPEFAGILYSKCLDFLDNIHCQYKEGRYKRQNKG